MEKKRVNSTHSKLRVRKTLLSRVKSLSELTSNNEEKIKECLKIQGNLYYALLLTYHTPTSAYYCVKKRSDVYKADCFWSDAQDDDMFLISKVKVYKEP